MEQIQPVYNSQVQQVGNSYGTINYKKYFFIALGLATIFAYLYYKKEVKTSNMLTITNRDIDLIRLNLHKNFKEIYPNSTDEQILPKVMELTDVKKNRIIYKNKAK